MTMTEERLRAALREGMPQPMDGAAIAAAARRRRALGLARVGVAAAALVLVAGFGIRMVGNNAAVTGVEPGATMRGTTPNPVAVPRTEDAVPGNVRESNSDIVPGRSLLVFPERWCLVGSSDGREVGCAAREERVQRITDDRGENWLVLLAPSGPDTAVLQVEQRAAWVSLRSAPVPSSGELWIGVLPSSEVPESPRGLRGLNANGQEIWRG